MGKLIKGTNDLLTINPELAKELCFDKNRPLTASDISYGSQKKCCIK